MDVDIDGPGANTLDISGNSAFQVFNIASGVNATVAGLTVTEGFSESNGGGIDDSGTYLAPTAPSPTAHASRECAS